MARIAASVRLHRPVPAHSSASEWDQEESPAGASLDRKMEDCIAFFGEMASAAPQRTERAFYEHLKAMAVGIQENRRFLDHLQMEIDEVHRELRSR